MTHRETGSVGEKSGFGASKRRSREHYSRIGLLSWVGKRRTIAERFWEKVDKKTPDECWNWTGCFDPKFGHGRFSVNNKSKVASRVAWEITNGHPGNLYVCHKCDNPKCCNPSHLFLGTPKDNMDDMAKKGRRKSFKGCKIFTPDKLSQIREEYKTARTPHSKLAKKFGCSKCTIHRIIAGKV